MADVQHAGVIGSSFTEACNVVIFVCLFLLFVDNGYTCGDGHEFSAHDIHKRKHSG